MDTRQSFKGYGKVDEADELAFRQKTRRRYIIFGISSVILIAVIIGAVAGVVIHNRKSDGNGSSDADKLPPTESPAASLKAVCSVTEYPASCYSSISELEAGSNSSDPELLFKLSLQVAMAELSKLRELPSKIQIPENDTAIQLAVEVCSTVLDDSVDRLNDSIATMASEAAGGGQPNQKKQMLSKERIEDLKTWLSTAVTDLDTCLDAMQLNETEHSGSAAILQQLETAMENSTELVSNSLAIVTKVMSLLSDFNIPIHKRRKLMTATEEPQSELKLGFPRWLSRGDRRLLQASGGGAIKPNVTVAQDGTGDFTTIREAVPGIPKKSPFRYIIYIKEGVYKENVILEKHLWNVMIYGDGKEKTVVSGNLNFIDGTPTFSTPTFAAVGKGFMARDIKFINTAGPSKHQAVAFRSGADMSVYYQCAFDAYQDTLYPHSNRQFYKDCDITGTIDFIFGNAAVVFQGCNIMPRQPLPNQFNTITAQGKKDPNQNTGISIQKCSFSPLDKNLTARTYLGRPWKDYSTTVIMQSSIDGFLSPVGWLSWVSGVDPPSTIFYAEYQNTGPGAGVEGRVKWAGYRPGLTSDEAGKFTVESFLHGSTWLPATSVAFDSTL
ncbi:Pectinesterase 3 [Linum grandiflorum]